MIEVIDTKESMRLADHASNVYLSAAVRELRLEAQIALPKLQGRTVWMVNSSAHGGGVAEMMPKLVGIMRDLGVKTEWVVIGTQEAEFFSLTKRIHNLIHDFGRPGFSRVEQVLYDRVSRSLADEMQSRIGPDDILVIHDPQPLGMGAELKRRTGIRAIWRCHIGLDQRTPATTAAWDFLKSYAEAFDHAVFSAPEYIPHYLVGRASIIYPSIDPLSHKNREFHAHKLVGILSNAGLMASQHPVLTAHWKHQAKRLQPDGRFAAADSGLEIGLLFRPIVTQISRWDRLKGWEPLLKGFLLLKARGAGGGIRDNRHKHRIDIARLVLAGPDPSAIQDDPEGREVLKGLCDAYCGLKPEEQESVALLTLPMASRKQNHLMVNAVQRCSTVVVQNSLREGFGLTATEAMWKRIPVLGSSACGLRHQIRDGIDGRLTRDPLDPEEIAENLDQMLAHPATRDMWGRNAQRRVYDRYLVYQHVHEWLQRLADVASRG
jgi:trehalose synthase